MVTVTLAHSLSENAVYNMGLPPGDYTVGAEVETDRTTALRLIHAGLTTINPRDPAAIDAALGTAVNEPDETTVSPVVGRWYVDSNRVPVDLAAVRAQNRTPSEDIYRINLHVGGMMLTYRWARAGVQIPLAAMNKAEAYASTDPVPDEPVFAPGGFNSGDLAAAAASALNAQRNAPNGVAGLDGDGHLAEIVLPDRLSVTALGQAYLQTPSTIAGFTVAVQQIVTLMRDQGLLGTSSGGPGVTTHGALSGLEADDHPQYHTDARGDARYYTKAQVDTAVNAPRTHASLLGLTADDHPQYHTDARGDLRYYPRAEADAVAQASRNRANHFGFQETSTLSDWTERFQDTLAASVVAGSGVVLSYDDAGTGRLTITAVGGGGGDGTSDPEVVRDIIGAAMLAGNNMQVIYDPETDQIQISTVATVNSTDAELRDRSTHDGQQAMSTVTGLVSTLEAKVDKVTGARPMHSVPYTDPNMPRPPGGVDVAFMWVAVGTTDPPVGAIGHDFTLIAGTP